MVRTAVRTALNRPRTHQRKISLLAARERVMRRRAPVLQNALGQHHIPCRPSCRSRSRCRIAPRCWRPRRRRFMAMKHISTASGSKPCDQDRELRKCITMTRTTMIVTRISLLRACVERPECLVDQFPSDRRTERCVTCANFGPVLQGHAPEGPRSDPLRSPRLTFWMTSSGFAPIARDDHAAHCLRRPPCPGHRAAERGLGRPSKRV